MDLVRSFSVLREGHNAARPSARVWVPAFALSPQGDTIACGYSDGAVALWYATNAGEFRLLQSPEPAEVVYDGILSVAFSPDGSLLVSTNHGRSPDRAAYVWDARSGAVIYRLGGFRYRLYAASFSPDGKVLALAGDDHVIKLFDVATGGEVSALPRLPDSLSALAFSPDGSHLAVGGDHELLVIYRLADGSERRLEGHLEWTYALAFHPNGQFFASGGEDQLVWMWEVKSGRRLRELRGHGVPGKHWGGIVYCVAFSLDGTLLASASGDMTARLWDVATGTHVGTLTHPRHDFRDELCWAAFHPRGGVLLTGSTSGQVHVWSRESEQQPHAGIGEG